MEELKSKQNGRADSPLTAAMAKNNPYMDPNEYVAVKPNQISAENQRDLYSRHENLSTAGRVSDLQSLRQAGDPGTNPNSMTLQPKQSVFASVGQNSLRPPDKISLSMPTSVGPDRMGPPQAG